MSFFGPLMPLPSMEPDTQEFWENCRQHRLTVQRCIPCGAYRFAPSPMCYDCQSQKYEWVESQGIAEVYTWIIVHHATHPGVTGQTPYNATCVRLLDCGGAKMMTNLVGIDNDSIKAGMKVKVEWDDVTPEVTLARFRPI